MTRELIIEGQHVDLAPDTDITLEFVNNIIGDIGKINLSRSYTVRIPKTVRNTRILDDPGSPGHESGVTRRFLSARYYRNGIDLIGPAQAYILKTTPESYEIALVWNTLEALQTLSQYSGTLNDLPNLPTLTWIGPNGTTPDYTGGNDDSGAIFAFYNSGLGGVKYPTVDTSTHPSFKIESLIRRILANAGVPYELSTKAKNDIKDLAILAAPKHEPSREMEIDSGSVANLVKFRSATINGKPGTMLEINDWKHGWDAPSSATGWSQGFTTGNNDTHRVLLNLQSPEGVDFTGFYLYITGQIVEDNVVQDQEELMRAYFKQNSAGWYLYIDEEIKLSGWPTYAVGFGNQLNVQVAAVFTPYKAGLPLLAANRVHKNLAPSKINRFPMQGNLPDIKQWDTIKACMAMFGWAAVIQNGTLHLLKYAELFSTAGAYNWTAKVDMTDGAPQEFGYTLDNWAQMNTLTFKEDTPVGFEPNASLEIQDATLPEQRDFYELPFAASMQSEAPHYKVDGAKAEDVNIEPRIFQIVNKDGVRSLEFTESLYGKGLIDANYAEFQEVIRKPVKLTVNIRLHEIDLAQLDLTRAVYLEQYGKYYMILKIQTSGSDLCKVELLQLP